MYEDADAVIVVDDEQIGKEDDTSLIDAIREILVNSRRRQELVKNIHAFAKPHAASDMAALILRAAGAKIRRSSATIDHK